MNSQFILNFSARPLNCIYNWRVCGRYSPLILARFIHAHTCACIHACVFTRVTQLPW